MSLLSTSSSSALAGRHILFVISSLGAGGAERVIAKLAAHLMDAGAQISIVAFDRESEPIYHDFAPGTGFHRLGDEAAPAAFRSARRMIALRRTIRRLVPDIVISFLTKINVISLTATIGLDVPVIVSERNNMLRQPMNRLWRMGVAALFPRAAAIVLQTAASAAMLPARLQRKAVVISNPIERLPWRPAGFADKRITAAGRLTEQKGFDTLIEAFAKVAPLHPDWQLDIWGEGENRDELLARIARLGLIGRADLRGLSKRPGQWIESASLFILSSRYEGFPNVLGEAMAAGMPVIATDCPFGPVELVQDGRNGLLVPQDNPAALAEAMIRLIENPDLAARLGASAARVARTYSSPSIVARWERLIEACLAAPAGQATGHEITERNRAAIEA